MTRDTRSDLLFAALAAAVTYGLAGPVPAVVVAAVALLVSFGVAGPLSALRDVASSAWDAVRGVGSLRGASLSLRWVVVVFLAGVLCGRGFEGVRLPDIHWPSIDWPVVVPDIIPDPTGPLTAVVVYETTEPLAEPQYQALYSEGVKDYIASHFAVRDGHAEWRILDDDATDLDEESTEIQAAFATAAATPGERRIAIRRAGQPVFEGELPVDEAGLLSLLKKYGGE